MYNKLFQKILDSSIWLESTPTRIVWLTFIAAMDEKGFVQFASVANVAYRARVTLEEAEAAIATLEGPDPHSGDLMDNPENEGRRIERVPGGWIVINAGKHRDLVTKAIAQEQNRERVRRFRAKKSGNGDVMQSEADADVGAIAEASAVSETSPPSAREIIGGFLDRQKNTAKWKAILDGYAGGLNTPGGKAATPSQIAGAILEIEAMGGDVTPLRFRKFLEVMMNGGDKPRANGRRPSVGSRQRERLEAGRAIWDTNGAKK